MDIEAHNYEQIEMLNQRGGRTLSIVDLIHAGTISVPMAACGLRAMANGASLLTAARPGGAGKTTLMASLLHFLPPDVPIITTARSAVVSRALGQSPDSPACYLAHEIGAGHWHGYIWGRDVADFLSLIEGQRRIASCLHADALPELTDILTSPPLNVSPDQLARVDMVLFMHVRPTPHGIQRRVATFYEADGQGGHRLLYEWHEAPDSFRQAGDLADPDGLAPYTELVQRLVDDGDTDARAVRRKVLAFHASL